MNELKKINFFNISFICEDKQKNKMI